MQLSKNCCVWCWNFLPKRKNVRFGMIPWDMHGLHQYRPYRRNKSSVCDSQLGTTLAVSIEQQPPPVSTIHFYPQLFTRISILLDCWYRTHSQYIYVHLFSLAPTEHPHAYIHTQWPYNLRIHAQQFKCESNSFALQIALKAARTARMRWLLLQTST